MKTRLAVIESMTGSAAEAAAKDWMRRQSANVLARMHVWYKPGTIAFWIGEEGLNDKWQQAEEKRVSPSWTPEQVARHITQIAKQLPLLGCPEQEKLIEKLQG